MRLGEDHPTLRGLENLGHSDVDIVVCVPSTILHNHHSAVVQIAHALIGLCPLLDDAHFQRLSVKDGGFDSVGQFIDVEHSDAL